QRRINRRKAKPRANEAAVGAATKSERKEGCGNDGAVKSVESQKQAPPSFHEPLGNLANSRRDSHISTAPAGVTCLRQNSRQAKNREVWAVEKWKSKTRIPIFPPPRPPAAARKKPILWMNPRGRLGGARGDISKEVWQRRFPPPAGQGVIVVDREK